MLNFFIFFSNQILHGLIGRCNKSVHLISRYTKLFIISTKQYNILRSSRTTRSYVSDLYLVRSVRRLFLGSVLCLELLRSHSVRLPVRLQCHCVSLLLIDLALPYPSVNILQGQLQTIIPLRLLPSRLQITLIGYLTHLGVREQRIVFPLQGVSPFRYLTLPSVKGSEIVHDHGTRSLGRPHHSGDVAYQVAYPRYGTARPVVPLTSRPLLARLVLGIARTHHLDNLLRGVRITLTRLDRLALYVPISLRGYLTRVNGLLGCHIRELVIHGQRGCLWFHRRLR